MNNNFKKYLELHSKGKAYCKNIFSKILSQDEDSSNKFFETVTALILLNNKIDSIIDGIIRIHKTNNIVCQRILYRSLLDHVAKVLYMFQRVGEEKNDNVGNEFLKIYTAYDFFKFMKSLDEGKKVIGEESIMAILDEIKRDFPGLDGYSSSDINKIAKQYDFRNALTYYYEHSDKRFKPQLIRSFFETFSKYSSTVHGGLAFDNFFDENETHEIDNLVSTTVIISAAVKFFIAILLMASGKNPEFYKKTSNLYSLASKNIN